MSRPKPGGCIWRRCKQRALDGRWLCKRHQDKADAGQRVPA